MIRKIAALVLLLFIPLQGAAAASLSVLQCSPAAAGVAYAPNSDDGAAQGEGDSDGKAIHDPFFCHPSVSAIPVIPKTSPAPEVPVFVPSVSLLSSLFVPEQPHRPPFVALF